MPHAITGVSLFNRLRVRALWSQLLKVSPSGRLLLETGTLTIPLEVKQWTCATAVPSGIRSLVPVPPAKTGHISGAVTRCSSQPGKLMYLLLAGRNGRPTAQRLCLPRRELLVAAEKTVVFDIAFDRQVSKPCPFRDSCSSLGSSQCHSTLLKFPL